MRAVLLLCGLALMGCLGGPIRTAPGNGLSFPSGSKWLVLQQPLVNPFRHREGAPDVTWFIKPLSFDRMEVEGKPLAVYTADLSEGTRGRFQDDLRKSAELFGSRLHEEGQGLSFASLPSAGAFTVEPTVASWDPGEFGLMVSRDCQMVMVFSIFDPQGRRIEAAGVRSRCNAGVVSGWRMHRAAEGLGEYLAEYLHSRVHSDP